MEVLRRSFAALISRHEPLRTAFSEEMGRPAQDVTAPELIDVPLTRYDLSRPGREQAADSLRQTVAAQPSLFTIEYALARLFMSWGVSPTAMIGHSVGELVAACLAGVFDVADALRLVVERARLIQSLPTGAMLAVGLPEHELIGLAEEGLSLAAVNDNGRCVVSGPCSVIDDFAARLADAAVPATRLQTSHAFHSAMMDPILPAFTAAGP